MGNECHFCRGIVSLYEQNDLRLTGHSDHQVFMHKECAVGHDLVEQPPNSADGPIEVACPKCGAIETL